MTWMGYAVAGCIILCGIVGYYKGFIREAFSLVFLVLTMVIVWAINPYVSDFLKENTPVYTIVQENCQKTIEEQLTGSKESDETDEMGLIENLPLPESLKQGILKNNTQETYQALAVDTLSEYIADYLATMITNGIGFILSYLIAMIGLRILASALNVVAHLPVISGVNHLAGALLGLLKGVLFMWIAFLVITILCRTETGMACMKMIEEDPFLLFLYNKDVFVQIFLNVV